MQQFLNSLQYTVWLKYVLNSKFSFLLIILRQEASGKLIFQHSKKLKTGPLGSTVQELFKFIWSPGSGQFHMFLAYVIKVDKREVPRLYFEHIMCSCCFRFFQENYPYAVKKKNVGSYPLFNLLNQANFICFWHMTSKLIKKGVIRLYFEHIYVLLLFSVFPGKLHLCCKSD